MKKNKEDNFKEYLFVFIVSILPTIVKSENTSDTLDNKNSVVSCNHSTEDLYGQGPFYITMPYYFK